MADDTLRSEGMDDFNKELEANIRQIERLSRAADKASNSIDKLSKTYDKLSKMTENPIDFNIKSGKNNSKNKNSGKNNLFNNINKLSDTATSASKPMSNLVGNITKLGIATGGTVAAISLLSKITLEAQRNTSSYARSLTIMNNELTRLDKRSIETSNKINVLNNRMSNLMQGIGEVLSPLLDFIVDLADVATSMLPDNERKDKVAGLKAGISSSAHQSGMTTSTGNVLANGTYNAALGLADKFPEQASEIADKLAKAWQTGSDAAKDYGVVLNDNVLTGYLATKGIDIANVEITDAMKQYYRYQLMIDQTSGKVTNSMIKDWTSLGFMIDKTKGKLFSFDEVIQLVAADPTIPELAGGDSGDSLLDNPEVGSNENISDNTNNIEDASNDLTDAAGLLNNSTDNLNNSTNNLTDAAGLLNNAADTLASAENTNANTLNLAGDTMNNASNNMMYSADTMMIAADNFNNVSDIIVIAFDSVYNNIVMGAAVLANAINNSMNNAANALNAVTQNGISLINDATTSGIMALTNATSYMNNSLMATTQSGLMAISNATSSGISAVNSATKSGVDNIIDVTEYSVTDVSNTGKSWVNQIQQVGQQILAKMASYAAKASVGSTVAGALGLGSHYNIASNIANDVKANVSGSKSKFGVASGAIKGIGTGIAKGTMANTSALITSPFDIITEGADLINSLKNEDTGKYEVSKLPSALLGMAWSSIKNPLQAISSGASYGYNATKDNTGSVILGGLGGLTGGITNAVAYGALETFGDLVNVGEIMQDITVGGYNKLTGSNIKSETGLNNFSNNVDTLLNDLVTGNSNSGLWDWIKSPTFADGGIGTHEVHNATLFENNKREAVIPLETSAGVEYLANAMNKAGAGNNSNSGDIVVNLTLSGINLSNNDAEWERVGRKIGEVIDIQRQRRGELNYGSNF